MTLLPTALDDAGGTAAPLERRGMPGYFLITFIHYPVTATPSAAQPTDPTDTDLAAARVDPAAQLILDGVHRFVATDAAIPASVLQTLLERGVAPSFNCITVDSDTSTSDTLLLFATGQAAHPAVSSADDPALAGFAEALNAVLADLALQVARDGEGAQKLIRIEVTGAVSAISAKRIAFAIAHSPLVKTAVAGEDANWGRIVMAVGKAGEPADRDRLAVGIGGTWMARDGTVVAGYDEAPVVAHMKGREILIAVDIGLGEGAATVWTCDLTHGYIDINGSYRS